MIKIKSRSSFNHDGRDYRPGDAVEVDETLAGELARAGLVEEHRGHTPEHEAKRAPAPENKKARDPENKAR